VRGDSETSDLMLFPRDLAAPVLATSSAGVNKRAEQTTVRPSMKVGT
jgi:hypothetical protein